MHVFVCMCVWRCGRVRRHSVYVLYLADVCTFRYLFLLGACGQPLRMLTCAYCDCQSDSLCLVMCICAHL